MLGLLVAIYYGLIFINRGVEPPPSDNSSPHRFLQRSEEWTER